MKRLLFILAFLPLLVFGQQTAQLNFTYKNGATWGRWKVMDLPTSLFTYSVPQGQLLIFYPPKYADTTKKCGLILFHPGDGEMNSLDVTQCVKNSLPRMIQAGMTPYSILPNKDTLFWIVACIHNNAGSAYRTQQAQIIPWILDKSGIRYDPKRVWVTGLSGGGSATHASVMIDTATSARVTGGIMPMANGGFDDKLPALQNNLIWYLQHGGHVFSYIGDQDPGFNSWKTAYRPLLQKYSAPEAYHEHIIPGGKHDASTWDVPWNSRVIWDSMGLIGYVAPPVNPLKGKAKIWIDSLTKHYPNTYFKMADSSSAGGIVSRSWGVSAYTGPDAGQWTSGGIFSPDMYLFNLKDGLYKIMLIIGDIQQNYDTAYVTVRAYGPPVCPICPVCPPQRKVKTLQVQLWQADIWLSVPLGAAKIGYDDGSNQ